MKTGKIYTIASVIVTLALAGGYAYVKITGKDPISPISPASKCDIRPEDNAILGSLVYKGELATPVITPLSPEYTLRTVIEKAYRETGVNFDGRYSVVSWECGTSCEESAVIDAETGRIVKFKLASEYGISVDPTSNLLIVNPEENIPGSIDAYSSDLKTSYYKMIDGNLVLICERKISGDRI